jgi:hypothetical protein
MDSPARSGIFIRCYSDSVLHCCGESPQGCNTALLQCCSVGGLSSGGEDFHNLFDFGGMKGAGAILVAVAERPPHDRELDSEVLRSEADIPQSHPRFDRSKGRDWNHGPVDRVGETVAGDLDDLLVALSLRRRDADEFSREQVTQGFPLGRINHGEVERGGLDVVKVDELTDLHVAGSPALSSWASGWMNQNTVLHCCGVGVIKT